MFNEGNSYQVPRDDAPRIADVFVNPNLPRPYLHAAVGRPRALYVLYPDETGREVLCRGAVLTYHELAEAERLTDQAWRERLDAAPPELPDWYQPIVGERTAPLAE